MRPFLKPLIIFKFVEPYFAESEEPLEETGTLLDRGAEETPQWWGECVLIEMRGRGRGGVVGREGEEERMCGREVVEERRRRGEKEKRREREEKERRRRGDESENIRGSSIT